jgi:hypothetical protein
MSGKHGKERKMGTAGRHPAGLPTEANIHRAPSKVHFRFSIV